MSKRTIVCPACVSCPSRTSTPVILPPTFDPTRISRVSIVPEKSSGSSFLNPKPPFAQLMYRIAAEVRTADERGLIKFLPTGLCINEPPDRPVNDVSKHLHIHDHCNKAQDRKDTNLRCGNSRFTEHPCPFDSGIRHSQNRTFGRGFQSSSSIDSGI